MAEHAHIVRIARYQPAPGKRGELLKRLQDGVPQVRDMEGCFGVQICESRESPGELVAVSRWASQSALDLFLREASAEMGELAQLMTGAPATEHFMSI